MYTCANEITGKIATRNVPLLHVTCPLLIGGTHQAIVSHDYHQINKELMISHYGDGVRDESTH